MDYFDSNQWWDEMGPFRLLHAWLPLRMRFITENIHQEYHEQTVLSQPLSGLHIVDVGCGGGLICEPLARLGAKVTGIDPSAGAIDCAKNHKDLRLHIDYVCQDPMQWHCPEPVDSVILFEVLEHVPNPFALIQKTQSWLKPGGTLIGSTINRTRLSALLAIGLAEYVLEWVPKGTHRWSDFITPTEIKNYCMHNGMERIHIQGCTCHPLMGWRYSPYSEINYFFSARILNAI